MGHGTEADGGSVSNEQGFLWLCGLCSDKPTFITVYDLFAHKKIHRVQSFCDTKDDDDDDDNNSFQLNKEEDGVLNVFESISSPELPKSLDAVTEDEDDDNLPLSALRLSTLCSTVENQAEAENNFKFELGLLVQPPVVKKEDPDQVQIEIEGMKVEDNDVTDDWIESVDDFPIDEKDESLRRSNSNKESLKNVCKICKEQFISRRILSKHKITHINPESGQYQCETCGKLCPKYDNFTRHLEIHAQNRKKPFSCEQCSASFYNMADLKRHAVLHLEVKPYTCDHCREGFTRQDALLIHMAKHTGVKCMKFTCKLCNKILNSPSALAMHSKNHTQKSIFCDVPDCTFSCYLKSQLRQHLRRHSGEKPFQCAICGRCFARSNDMKNHILNVHERVRPYKCQDCNKEFTLQSSLKTHRLIHLDVRPYLCAQCGKRFNHPSTLRKHTQFLHRHLCSPCTEAKDHRSSKGPETSLPQENVLIVKDENEAGECVSYATVQVQSQLPLMTIPIHIPQITVQLDPSFPQTYIIPTIALPVTQQI